MTTLVTHFDLTNLSALLFLFFTSTFSSLYTNRYYYISLVVIDLIDYYDHLRTPSFSGQI